MMDDRKDLHTIADHYGLRAQMQKTVEETGEMLAELGRLMLDGENEAIRLALLEEIADVEIMLDQLKYLLDAEEISEGKRQWKIRRQLDRIREEKAKKDE
jgi:hypothetical protein